MWVLSDPNFPAEKITTTNPVVSGSTGAYLTHVQNIRVYLLNTWAFELVMHATFVPDENRGDMLEPARRHGRHGRKQFNPLS